MKKSTTGAAVATAVMGFSVLTAAPAAAAPGDLMVFDWAPGAGPGSDGFSQAGQVPVGGADTGVAVEESSGGNGFAAGGLALLATGGAALVARRRTTGRA